MSLSPARPEADALPSRAGGLLKRFGEFLERAAANRGAEQCLQLGRVGDRLDFLAETLRDSLEADFECFEDVLLFGSNLTALHAFFVELFGE